MKSKIILGILAIFCFALCHLQAKESKPPAHKMEQGSSFASEDASVLNVDFLNFENSDVQFSLVSDGQFDNFDQGIQGNLDLEKVNYSPVPKPKIIESNYFRQCFIRCGDVPYYDFHTSQKLYPQKFFS